MPVAYLKETPSQTAGPYVHIGTYPAACGLAIRTQERPNVLSSRPDAIRIEGRVLDGDGAPVRDAMLELWQPDAKGVFQPTPTNAGFFGWGRAVADLASGDYWFETIKPGPIRDRSGQMLAPFISVLVFARGINIHLHTRLYFPEESAANAADPVLSRIEPDRRATLIADAALREGVTAYRFDIHLQGPRETVFFDV